ncbi:MULTISPECIES: hypothetical protein [unclassified Micromonospora]|uniref:hypothetical protein n=1 Tax=unclassified Micromonospora TaxID=2617518 RepID=UPI00363FABA0
MPPVAGTRPVCRQLSSGEAAAVLVIDFQALNGDRRLSELLADAADGERFYQVDPRGAVAGDRLYADLPALADEAVAVFRAEEPTAAADRRVFVVSHCSAAGLSLRIAGQLAGDREVTAILVEPTWPGPDDVVGRFAEFQGKLGAARPCPALDGDPWSCVAGMQRLMREDLTAMAQRVGLDTVPPAFTELLVAYRTWLAYLLACGNDLPAKPPAEAVEITVLSREPGFVVPGTAPGRSRVVEPPPGEPDAVTPDLVRLLLEQIRSR